MAKILIIEDDQFLSELITKKLDEEGFEVILATDGEKGWEKLSKEGPDLVLLDLLLPNIDGFEVLERKKKNEALAKIPVIVISNYGQESKIQRAMSLGASDYLVKANFTTGEIADKVRSVLEK